MKGTCRGKGWKDPPFHRKLKGYCLQEIEYRFFLSAGSQNQSLRPLGLMRELSFVLPLMIVYTSWVLLACWGKAQLWHHLCNHVLFLPLWAGRSNGQALENLGEHVIKAFLPTLWHHLQLGFFLWATCSTWACLIQCRYWCLLHVCSWH